MRTTYLRPKPLRGPGAWVKIEWGQNRMDWSKLVRPRSLPRCPGTNGKFGVHSTMSINISLNARGYIREGSRKPLITTEEQLSTRDVIQLQAQSNRSQSVSLTHPQGIQIMTETITRNDPYFVRPLFLFSRRCFDFRGLRTGSWPTLLNVMHCALFFFFAVAGFFLYNYTLEKKLCTLDLRAWLA